MTGFLGFQVSGFRFPATISMITSIISITSHFINSKYDMRYAMEMPSKPEARPLSLSSLVLFATANRDNRAEVR